MYQCSIGQVSSIIYNNTNGLLTLIWYVLNYIVDDEIQLDELDALKADLLSLQASVHKLVCC